MAILRYGCNNHYSVCFEGNFHGHCGGKFTEDTEVLIQK